MITVFIGTCNRLETLERTIASYGHLTEPHELVIVDNGSDDPESLDLLRRFKRDVKKIYHLPRCDTYEETTANFNVALRDQCDSKSGDWFAISEADICFDGSHPGSLTVYLELAQELGRAVGPHLRVDGNIPITYPLRSRVLACETWMYYQADMEDLDGIYYNPCQIDTSFHLFPKTRVFNRLKLDPIRVGPPYDAMHLDWYVDVFSPTRENQILIPDKRPLGSWGKSWIRDYWSDFQASPELAFDNLVESVFNPHDLCNNNFMLSWCCQYGIGTDVDLERSQVLLASAIPESADRYWSLEQDWMEMIYENDFECLGWE